MVKVRWSFWVSLQLDVDNVKSETVYRPFIAENIFYMCLRVFKDQIKTGISMIK